MRGVPEKREQNQRPLQALPLVRSDSRRRVHSPPQVKARVQGEVPSGGGQWLVPPYSSADRTCATHSSPEKANQRRWKSLSNHKHDDKGQVDDIAESEAQVGQGRNRKRRGRSNIQREPRIFWSFLCASTCASYGDERQSTMQANSQYDATRPHAHPDPTPGKRRAVVQNERSNQSGDDDSKRSAHPGDA